MRKKNASLILVGALTATAAVAGASASDQTSGSSTSTTTSTQNAYQTPPSPGSQSSTTSSTSQTQDSAYWAAQRLEMQKKSSEMRVKKVAEMKAAGIDVSALTGDILDGTKTEESVFWTAAKAAMDAHEIDARKKVLETLKAKGIDTSSITDDVISDGGKFWEAVRKLTQNGGASTQPTGTQTTAPTTPPSNPTGTTTSSNSSNELKSFLRSDLTQDELKAVEGIIAETGKSIFTILNDATLSVDDKIAKIQAAQRATAEKIASYVDSAKLEAFKAWSEEKIAQMSAYIRKGLIKGSPSNPKDRPQNSPSEKNTTDATTASTGTEKNQDTAGNKRKRNVRDAQATTGERVAGTNIGNGDVRPNVLPPKFRKDLETKLRAIPDEKKAAFYDRAKTILATQIEKAKAAGNSKLTRKLEAVQSIIEDTLGQTAQEDGAILNSIFTDTTAAQ